MAEDSGGVRWAVKGIQRRIDVAASRIADAAASIEYMRNSTYRLSRIARGHHNFTWRGVVARKSPFDLALLQMVIAEVNPELIIEVGTNHGGSALFMADMLELQGAGGIVHTLDVEDHGVPHVVQAHPRIHRFLTGWQGYPIDEAKGFSKVMVIDDGSHVYGDCLGAMERFAPLVTPGSYLIVEDGSLTYLGWSRRYAGGPMKAISDFLASHKDFTVARDVCDLFGRNYTFNPDGYLRRNGTVAPLTTC